MISTMRGCTAHSASRAPQLSSCTSVAPSGTGTTTITMFLRHVGSRYTHHDHSFTLRGFRTRRSNELNYTFAKGHTDEPPRCFLLSLREPAARMESLKRFGDGSALAAHRFPIPRPGSNISARAAELAYLQQALTPMHDVVSAAATASVSPQWWHARGRGSSTVSSGQGSLLGFLPQLWINLVPQLNLVDYVLPLQSLERECATGAIEIHPLCNEHLDTSLEALRTAFGVPSGGDGPIERHQSRSSASAYSTLARNAGVDAGHLVINRSRLEDAALRRWVNECVFHADSALWRAFCPRGAARAGR